MVMLGQFLRIPENFEPFHDMLGPGAIFTKGLKWRVLSLDLSHDLGQDSRCIH